MRIKSLTLLLLLLGPLALFAKQPNILFILADDLGWKDTAVSGSTFYKTPHIDALAAEGMRFTDAYATPLCSPSRAAVITGRQPERMQMHSAITKVSKDDPIMPEEVEDYQRMSRPQSRNHIPLEEITMAEVLKEAGYATHFIGKWHAGAGRYLPQHQGFDNVVVAGHAAAGFFAPYKWLNKGFSRNSPQGEYLPERFSTEAIKIFRKHKESGEPFFMALWHFNVHSPYEAKPEVIEKYEALVDPNNPQKFATMGAMIEGLDDSVGAVVAELKSLGMYEDTIIIFASDNGGVGMPERKPGSTLTPTSNLPFRGWKGTIVEGGIRVPFIARWSGVTEAGSVNKTPVHLVDLMPTFARAAGAELPDVELDGIDLRPALEGDVLERERPLFWFFPSSFIPNGKRPAAAIRESDHKLIRFFGDNEDFSDKYELYNVALDPAESMDLANKHPELVASLTEILDSELERIGARIPFPNPAYNPDAPEPRHWQQYMLNP